MKPPEEPIRSQVASWLAKANDDYQLIERLAAEADEFPAIVAFHSHQASEKYIKALLVVHQIDFPKTHDIKQLLALLRPAGPPAQKRWDIPALTRTWCSCMICAWQLGPSAWSLTPMKSCAGPNADRVTLFPRWCGAPIGMTFP